MNHRQQVVEFYINRAQERNIVEEFKQIFEHGLTGAALKTDTEEFTKSMKEELHNQIDELFKGEA